MKREPRRLPLWKEDLSFRSGDERFVMRRQFGKFMVLTSFGMFAGNLWILARSWMRWLGRKQEPVVAVAMIGELGIGDVKAFTYPTPNDPCLLIRLDAVTWVAYSQKCTHLSCAVVYEKESMRLACPCHRGYFSVETGRVLQGPPPRPLPRVRIEPRSGRIVALGMEEIHA